MKESRLTVIETYMKMTGSGKRIRYARCICECGNEKDIIHYRVKNNITKSCGCISSELTAKRNLKHGLSKHPAYYTYNSMMARCYNKNHKNYPHYGGRGVRVNDEWHDVGAFLKWCDNNGFRKEYQLDRIDNDGNYGPGNCRFITPIENLRNTRHNVIIKELPLRVYLDNLSDEHNIGFPTLRYRYYTITKEGLEPTEDNLIYHERWNKKVTS